MFMNRKAFRLLVTEKCNMRCKTCFNKDIRTQHEMSLSQFTDICKLLKDNGVERIKLMGGEPTTHSNFLELYSIAQDLFPKVYLFTNAVNNQIFNIVPRQDDAIIYNLSCMPVKFKPEKLLLDQLGQRIFETRIDSDCRTELILRKLDYLNALLHDRLVVNLTLNCIEDIFSQKDSIIQKWNVVGNFVKEHTDGELNLDHDAPLCFTKDSDMILAEYNPKCSTLCAGLISADYQLRYCNQVTDNIGSVYQDGALISYDDINQKLDNYFEQQMLFNRDHFCKGCADFMQKCNGSCFAHKICVDGQAEESCNEYASKLIPHQSL